MSPSAAVGVLPPKAVSTIFWVVPNGCPGYGDIFHGSRGLRRSSGPGPDVFAQVRHLPVGIIVGQRRIAQRRQFPQKARREWRDRFLGGAFGSKRSFRLLLRCGSEDERNQYSKHEKASQAAHTDQEITSVFELRCIHFAGASAGGG